MHYCCCPMYEVEAGPVGIHDTHLRSAIERIDRPLGSGVKVKERSEATGADNNLLAVGRPRRSKDQTVLFENGAGRLAFIDDEQAGCFAVGAYVGDARGALRWDRMRAAMRC